LPIGIRSRYSGPRRSSFPSSLGATRRSGWEYPQKGIEPETGKPIVDPAHKPVVGKRIQFCPALWGGKVWPSAAYSEKTKYVYIPANENFCGGFSGEKVPLVPGQLWLGTSRKTSV